jgi:hypothetical protein
VQHTFRSLRGRINSASFVHHDKPSRKLDRSRSIAAAPASTLPISMAAAGSLNEKDKPRRAGTGPFDCLGSGKLLIGASALLSLLYVFMNSPLANGFKGRMDVVRCARNAQ